MTERETKLNTCISMIKGEYREMPGLHLTRPQVRRMWGLGESECDVVLDRLQSSAFLRLSVLGGYVLVDSEHD